MKNFQLKLKQLNRLEKFYFSFLVVLVVLPFLAPVFSAAGLHFLAKPIYFIYSFFCHQFDTRSLHLFDHQVAWCARDMGIWLGVLVGSIAFKTKLLKSPKWYWIFLFMLPIALDGGLQTIDTLNGLNSFGVLRLGEHAHISNNLLRFLTGSFSGIGLGLILTPRIIDKDNLTNWKFDTRFDFIQLRNLAIVILSLVLVYIVLVQAWALTSSKYEPTNILDSEAKIPRRQFFIRREHGECPVNATEDFLAIDCFF